jgi:hypothetical protein
MVQGCPSGHGVLETEELMRKGEDPGLIRNPTFTLDRGVGATQTSEDRPPGAAGIDPGEGKPPSKTAEL